jgi:hypothetical protein
MSWPRGKYNGRPIEGFLVSFSVHLLWWQWKPLLRWNFGEPYFIWLCFSWRAKAEYHERIETKNPRKRGLDVSL